MVVVVGSANPPAFFWELGASVPDTRSGSRGGALVEGRSLRGRRLPHSAWEAPNPLRVGAGRPGHVVAARGAEQLRLESAGNARTCREKKWRRSWRIRTTVCTRLSSGWCNDGAGDGSFRLLVRCAEWWRRRDGTLLRVPATGKCEAAFAFFFGFSILVRVSHDKATRDRPKAVDQ